MKTSPVPLLDTAPAHRLADPRVRQPSARLLLPVLLAALAVSGCAALAPPVPLPAQAPAAAAVPAQWQAPAPAAAGAVAPSAAWWSQWSDPALPGLVAAAQAASPGVAQAKALLERARAALTAAGAAGQPQVQAGASASQARQAVGAPQTLTAGVGLQAQWELDLFGALAAGQRAAQQRQWGAQAAQQATAVAVAAETAALLVRLRGCEAQLEQTGLDTRSREETARLTDASARAGFTAPAEAALARAGAAQARGTLRALQAQCTGFVLALAELTDIPPERLRASLAPGQGRVPSPPPLALGALPAQLLAQRPDLVDSAAQVAAAAQDHLQRQAQQRPQVTLSGNLLAGGVRNSGETTRGLTWTLGPLQVLFPVWDGGARAANTAAARAAYDEAVALYQAQARQAWREVESALLALDSTAARQADVDAAAQDFEASLRATAARQRGGLASLFDLEAARRNAVLAQSARIELALERTQAWIALYRALGGGWVPPAASAPPPGPA